MTLAVPEPVIVPAAPAVLMTTAAEGLNTVAAPFKFKVPDILKLVEADNSAEVLVFVRLLKLVAEDPEMAWAVVPLKVTVLVPAVKVPLFTKSCERV